MEHGAGQDVQPQTLYREDAIRRILRAIDEAGGPGTPVDVQNAALRGILESDTFWHAKRDGALVKYDLQKMRELAARVTRDAKLTPANGHDRVALLFHVQSRGLPQDLLLKWKFGPDEVLFENERSLTLATQRPVREDSTRMDDLAILEDSQEPEDITFQGKSKLFRYRAAWFVLQDIDASLPDRNTSDHKYSTRSMRVAALQDICRRFGLRYPASMTQLSEHNSDTLYKATHHVWRYLRAHDNIAFDCLWSEGSGSCRPDRLQEIKAAYDAFDGEGNISLAQALADPKILEHQHQDAFTENASSPVLIEDVAVASRPQSKAKSVETSTLITARIAEPRRLKRKASTATEESLSSEALSLSVVRQKSPVVCPTPRNAAPRDSEKARAPQMSNDQNAVRLDKPRHLSPRNVIQQLQYIRDLQLTQVQWMVGYFKLPRSPSPVTLTPEPNQLLAALYKRCWGDDWRRNGDLLLRQDKRSVFNDTLALISSFLFEHILTAAAP